nr:PQQ-dependent sugar dehydrogenase [Propionibacterium sp.]
MGRPRSLPALLAAGLLLAGCTPAPQTPTSTPSSPGPATPATSSPTPSGTPLPGTPFRAAELARYDEPWALEPLPGGDLVLITLKRGSLRLRDLASGQETSVQGVPAVVYGGQGGLGDVVAGPTFANDGTVYLSWVDTGEEFTGAVVGRARLVGDAASARLEGLEVIWRQVPKTSGSGHFSHRLAFSPDGRYLFVTSGDRQKFDPAQDLAVNLGKVLRLNPDGTPAAGNPFADRGGISAEIWSYGHRNGLGLAFDAAGNLWESEMGPQGGDELNLILPGRNYGWPLASNGSHYGGGEIPDHAPGDGFEAPKVWWTPSVSPAGIAIYTGTAFPDWQGDAFVGALSGQALIRVDLAGTTATKGDQWPMGERIRDVAQARDGSLLVLQDVPGGRLLRLTPVG